MPDNGKYFVGESLRQKLRSTIDRVDSISFGGPVSRIPTRFEEGPPQQGGSSMKFACFTGTSAWVIGTPKQVFMMETADNTATSPMGVMSTSTTAVAYSCLFSIPGNTSTVTIATSLIAMTKLNGNWQVIAANAN
jgi:hypothetical protein